MIVVLVRSFRVIIDLHFVAVMNRHPRLSWLERNTDEHSGIIVGVAHFVDHSNARVAHFAAHPIQKSHAAMRFNQSILDSIAAWPDMLPAGKVFAVKKRFPAGILPECGSTERDRHNKNRCDCQQQFSHAFTILHC